MLTKPTRFFRIFSFLIWMALFTPARAGDFNTVRHTAVSPSISFPGVETTEQMREKQWALRSAFAMENDPLVLKDVSGNKLFSVIDERYSFELIAAYGLYPWLEIGAALPGIVQHSIDRSIAGVTNFTDRGIGDARLFARMRIVENRGKGFSLGSSLSVTVPSSTVTFVGNDWPTARPLLIAGWRAKFFEIFTGVGAVVQKTSHFANATAGTGIAYSGGLLISTWIKQARLFGEVEGQTDKFHFSKRSMPVDARGGLLIGISKIFDLTLGYGRAITEGYGGGNYGGFLTLTYRSKPPEIQPLYWTAKGLKVVGNHIVLDSDIRFMPESDEIKPESFPSLDGVAQTIRWNPSMGKVYIEVFTDKDESEAAELYLASRRAQAIRQALIERSAENSRLDAKGLLPYKQIVTEKQAEENQKALPELERIVQFRFTPQEIPVEATSFIQTQEEMR